MPKDKKNLEAKNEGSIVVDTPEVKKKVVVVEEIEDSPNEEVKTNSEAKLAETKNDEQTKIENIQEDTLNETNTAENQENDSDADKPNYLWIIVPTALLVGALVGGLITYFSGVLNMSVATATQTPIANIEPNATPEPSPLSSPTTPVKRELLKVQVLNGSGVSGLANKVKSSLEKLGYKNVSVGNASNSDFATTEVAIKETKKEYLNTIIKDLSESYSAKESDKALSTSSAYDVVITIGKK